MGHVTKILPAAQGLLGSIEVLSGTWNPECRLDATLHTQRSLYP